MADNISTRRSFLTSVGTLSAAGLVSRDLVASAAGLTTAAQGPRSARGLALGPDDFAFAPGLLYFQTGSLGPTPRPVMERTIAAWKELELDVERPEA